MTYAEIRKEALHIFGRLLRVQKKTFAGDTPLIKGINSRALLIIAASEKTRQEFEAGRNLADNLVELQKRVKTAKEVCELLEHNVIQAQRTAGTPDKPYYKLNFRPEIEINDGHMKGHMDKIGKCC